MILLTDKELLNIEVWLQAGVLMHNAMARKNDRQIEAPEILLLRRKVAKAQLKKMVGVLKDKTVKAWGGNRVILSEDWQAILKECE